MKRGTTKPPTLCWRCQRACPSPELGCSWAKHFEPVPGWDAEPTTIGQNSKGQTYRTRSYHVKACPEFLADPPPQKKKINPWEAYMYG